MKKILAVIIIVLALIGLYFLGNKKVSAPSETVPKTSSRADLSNITFTTDDGPLTLKDGKAERSVIPGSEIRDEFTLTDAISYGDLNKDGKDDTAGLIVETTTGTGVFFYLAAAISGPVAYKGTNIAFIGDRISPKSVSISGGNITVSYLDRKPDEPLTAEPTVLSTKSFAYKDGELIEK